MGLIRMAGLRWRLLPIVVIFIGLSSSVFAAGPDKINNRASSISGQEKFESDLHVFLESQMAEYRVPGLAFVLVQDGKTTISEGLGFADLESRIPVAVEKTVFRIASVSKLFTATAVMQLVERGEIDLDADINRYLQNFSIPDTFSEPITTHHLLTHTTGFEDMDVGFLTRNPEKMRPLSRYIAENMPARINPPGTVQTYSNYGITLAGYLVEAVSGVPFSQFVEENIFRPAGMNMSTFQVLEVPKGIEANRAVGYESNNGTYHAVLPAFPRGGVSPEGGMLSTAYDAAQFIRAMLSDQQSEGAGILNGETRLAMLSRQYSAGNLLPGSGYGFWEKTADGYPVFFHSGDTEGFASEMVLIPELNIGYFVVYNGYSWALKGELFDWITNNDFLIQPRERPDLPTVEVADLSIFEGAYRSDRYNRSFASKLIALTEISAEVTVLPGGRLKVVYFGLLNGLGGAWEYAPIAPLVFKNISAGQESAFYPGEYMSFAVDEAGKVTHFSIQFPTALEKVSALESNRVQTYALFGFVAFYLTNFVFFFVKILLIQYPGLRVWKKRKTEHADPIMKRTGWLILGISTLNLVFLVCFLPQLLQIKYGISLMLRIILFLPFLSAFLVLMLLWHSRRRKDRLIRQPMKGGYALLFASFSSLFLVWAFYWNLFA